MTVAPWARVVPRIKLRKKVRMEDFMIKNLFHGGSGGFNGDGTSDGYCLWSEAEKEGMGLLVVRPSGM